MSETEPKGVGAKLRVNPRGWIRRHALEAALLGTVTTIAVAWWSAIELDPYATTIEDFSVPMAWNPSESVRVIEVRTATGVRREYLPGSNLDRYGPHMFRAAKRASLAATTIAAPGESPPGWGRAPWRRRSPWFEQREWGLDDARGWPCLALWCEIDANWNAEPATLTTAGAIRIPWPPTPNVADLRVLPCRPIWGGFLLNTLVFGSGWFVLGLMLPWMRSRRVRFGQCPRCRHDVLGSGGPERGCTECGWNREDPKNTHGR